VNRPQRVKAEHNSIETGGRPSILFSSAPAVLSGDTANEFIALTPPARESIFEGVVIKVTVL
jgi:hypothetical protein